MIKKYLTMAILVLLVTPVLVQANDDSDTRWYVAPYGSFVLTDSNRNTNDGWGGGLAVGKILNEHFNVELKGFYQDYGKISRPNSGNVNMAGGTADLQYYFFRDKFSPYAVLGAGLQIQVHQTLITLALLVRQVLVLLMKSVKVSFFAMTCVIAITTTSVIMTITPIAKTFTT